MTNSTDQKTDRRSIRSLNQLREALVDEIIDKGGIEKLTVAGIADAADVTRRTFYTHFDCMEDFIGYVEAGVMRELTPHIEAVAAATLDEVFEDIDNGRAIPHSVEIFEHFEANGKTYLALLGPCGDPSFERRINCLICELVEERLLTGIIPQFQKSASFKYYLEYNISALLGVIRRWVVSGMKESPEYMAMASTVMMFLRPGDLYGSGREVDFSMYSMKLLLNNDTAVVPSPAAKKED